MPFKSNRRLFKKKRLQRRVDSYRNQVGLGSIPRGIKHGPKDGIYPFRHEVTGSNMGGWTTALTTLNGQQSYFVQSSSAEVTNACYFRLGDVDNATALATLFDEYRIRKVQLRLRPTINMSVQAANTYSNVSPVQASVLPNGSIICAIDHDDATPVAASALRQFATAKVFSTVRQQPIVFNIYPQANTYVLNNDTTPAQGTHYKGWIDLAAPLAPYFGFKMVMQQGPAILLQAYEIDATYWFECRHVR